jgi:hypothetical protein
MKKLFTLLLFNLSMLLAVSQEHEITIDKNKVIGYNKESEKIFGVVTSESAKQYIVDKQYEICESKDSNNIYYQTALISLCDEYLEKYDNSSDFVIYARCRSIEDLKAESIFKRANLKFEGEDYRGTLYDYSSSILIARKKTSLWEKNLGILLYNRGYCYYNLNEKDSACKDWREAVDLGNYESLKLVKDYCQY